ncbi:Uncharacterised protein [Mycobacteroides abscessus subsp. abscessus]|nr:Uncharacterised protein [Mycobacteroides abscessus subsp. abscessus]
MGGVGGLELFIAGQQLLGEISARTRGFFKLGVFGLELGAELLQLRHRLSHCRPATRLG